MAAEDSKKFYLEFLEHLRKAYRSDAVKGKLCRFYCVIPLEWKVYLLAQLNTGKKSYMVLTNNESG